MKREKKGSKITTAKFSQDKKLHIKEYALPLQRNRRTCEKI